MAVEILPTHSPVLFEQAVARAASVLRSGGVVGLPTETVYGLAANALDPKAVQRIYDIKGRPRRNPVIVHVAGMEQAQACARRWPAMAETLASGFWPGPLTLVVERHPDIPEVVTAGGATVGLRWPQHPLMQAVIRACGFPLAAPSANLANQLSPTSALHVARELDGRIPLVVDGGQCQVGIESTVVDVTGSQPKVLRPGMISEAAIRRMLGFGAASAPAGAGAGAGPVENAGRVSTPGQAPGGPESDRGMLRSPGQLERHYAPRARLRVLEWGSEQALMEMLGREKIGDPSKVVVLAHTRIPSTGTLPHVCVIPDDPEAYARALYAELHRCDESGAEWIVVETPPAGPAWAGIHDRLRRASAPLG